jgi:hypothetical protein
MYEYIYIHTCNPSLLGTVGIAVRTLYIYIYIYKLGTVGTAVRTTKMASFSKYLMIKLSRYEVGPNWVQVYTYICIYIYIYIYI